MHVKLRHSLIRLERHSSANATLNCADRAMVKLERQIVALTARHFDCPIRTVRKDMIIRQLATIPRSA